MKLIEKWKSLLSYYDTSPDFEKPWEFVVPARTITDESFGDRVPSNWYVIKSGGETWRVFGWTTRGLNDAAIIPNVGKIHDGVANSFGVEVLERYELYKIVLEHKEYGREYWMFRDAPTEGLQYMLQEGYTRFVSPGQRMDWNANEMRNQLAIVLDQVETLQAAARKLTAMMADTPTHQHLDLEA
jgi:hypothetical protein